MTLTLTSPAFADHAFVPIQYTCDGDNISPPLKWSDVPDGTVEMVLLFEDPDGPGGMGGTQVYWVLFGLDPASGGVDILFAAADDRADVGAAGRDDLHTAAINRRAGRRKRTPTDSRRFATTLV